MGNNKQINIGTLNCRSLQSKQKKIEVAEDFIKFNLFALTTQETRLIKGKSAERIEISGKRLIHYHSGNEENTKNGVGIIVEEHLKATFVPINDRICMLKIKQEHFDQNIILIAVYAPTNPVSNKNPEQREHFYEELDTLVQNVNKRDILIIAGDLNAKTGSETDNYTEVLGKFGKGMANENGMALLEFCTRNGLVLTNTKFQHKMAHRTTWEAPERPNAKDRNGEPRRNPYRNQIDYVIIRKNHMKIVKDSRSFSNIETKTDHRLVIMKTKMKMVRPYYNKTTKKDKINLEKLKIPEYKERYQDKIIEKFSENDLVSDEDIQERWNRIVKITKESALEVLGKVESNKRNKINDPEIKKLSDEQKELRKKINLIKDKEKRLQMKKERNCKLNKIKQKIITNTKEKINKEVEELEQYKDDSRKMFQAIKFIKNRTPNKPLLIENKDKTGMTANEIDQVEVITNFFKSFFNKKNTAKLKDLKPVEMKIKFTESEIQKVLKCLKNNKSPGIDEIHPEQLKYSPDIISKEISNILNDMAKTGEKQKEITLGIPRLIQKEGKKQGPTTNLRPIILLSVLRKILAICMVNRIGEKLLRIIPKSQAAYQSGRSTTEQVFVFKSMAEKAISSNNYNTHILMMDMSKAFDTVKRDILLSDLKMIVDDDELHILKLLIDDVRLVVKCGNSLGVEFSTNVGVPQGDCLSPILFILYLSKALLQDSLYKQPVESPQKFSYIKPTKKILEAQYSDDISWITNGDKKLLDEIKEKVPKQLEKRNLLINPDKTEEHKIEWIKKPKKDEIIKEEDWSWKKCKILGSLIDTKEDIKRRKSLALTALNKLNDIWENKKITINLKSKIFNSTIKPIFLYNAELWTLSNTDEKQIDAFQRRLLRYMLCIKWPEKISTIALKEKLKFESWSSEIKRRRLSWCGHLLRLPEGCPAKEALILNEEHTQTNQSKKVTWLQVVKKQLIELNLNWENVKEIAIDRKEWKNLLTYLLKS